MTKIDWAQHTTGWRRKLLSNDFGVALGFAEMHLSYFWAARIPERIADAIIAKKFIHYAFALLFEIPFYLPIALLFYLCKRLNIVVGMMVLWILTEVFDDFRRLMLD